MVEATLRNNVADLLLRQRCSNEFSLEPLKCGRNNRVYKLVSSRQAFLLKEYFRHLDDSRDRCTTEFIFSTFAWDQNIRVISKPLACNAESGVALYEYKQGSEILPSDLNRHLIYDAIQFLLALNAQSARKCAQLPVASEACFSIADHINCVDARVEKLSNAIERSKYDQAKQFVKLRLVPAWRAVKEQAVNKTARTIGRVLDKQLLNDERLISPSDFGFHNSLLMSDKSIIFFDFEYAGWDDPAKTICDFFLQPAVPVLLDYFDFFVNVLLKDSFDKDRIMQRVKILFPVYQIKWCCILLNEFVPVSDLRRKFALGTDDIDEKASAQLNKAANVIEQINSEGNPIRPLSSVYP